MVRRSFPFRGSDRRNRGIRTVIFMGICPQMNFFQKKLTDQLIKHEGLRLKPYHCPAGKLTIGVGRNLEDKGITEEEAVMLLENDIQECLKDLGTIFQAFDLLPKPS